MRPAASRSVEVEQPPVLALAWRGWVRRWLGHRPGLRRSRLLFRRRCRRHRGLVCRVVGVGLLSRRAYPERRSRAHRRARVDCIAPAHKTHRWLGRAERSAERGAAPRGGLGGQVLMQQHEHGLLDVRRHASVGQRGARVVGAVRVAVDKHLEPRTQPQPQPQSSGQASSFDEGLDITKMWRWLVFVRSRLGSRASRRP